MRLFGIACFHLHADMRPRRELFHFAEPLLSADNAGMTRRRHLADAKCTRFSRLGHAESLQPIDDSASCRYADVICYVSFDAITLMHASIYATSA